jgi:uncharacterized membrane protein
MLSASIYRMQMVCAHQTFLYVVGLVIILHNTAMDAVTYFWRRSCNLDPAILLHWIIVSLFYLFLPNCFQILTSVICLFNYHVQNLFLVSLKRKNGITQNEVLLLLLTNTTINFNIYILIGLILVLI